MAAGDEIGAAVIRVTADTTGLSAGVAQAQQTVKNFADTANRDGVRAGEGLARSSDEATIAAIKLAREQDKLTAQVQRYAQTVGRSRGEVLEARAQALGLGNALQQQLTSIKAAEAALKTQTSTLNAYGLTAKQNAAALRQVPAQITDIVVGLQGGQAPLTVLLQQGGQLRDVFGGVVPALRALGGAIASIVTPVTAIFGTLALLGVAFVQGRAENERFAEALIVTGNAAGTTAGKLQDAAARIDGVIGTQAQAAAALTALAATGAVSDGNLERFATTAIRVQRTLGTSVEDTAKQFAELGRNPVDAVRRLNETTNFLTLDIFRQITALQAQGREFEAGEVAQRAFAAALDERTARLEQNFGIIERGWKLVSGAAREAWDQFLGIGRAETLGERITGAFTEVERLRGAQALGVSPEFGGDGSGTGSALAQAEARLEALREQERLLNRQAASEAERARNAKLQIDAQVRINELEKATQTNAQRRSSELRKLRADAELLGLSTEKINQLEKAINEKYKDPARRAVAVQDNEATRYLIRLREINGALNAQLVADEKLTDAERERAQFIAQIAELKTKSVLTVDQRSLLAAEQQILKQLDLNAAVSREVVQRQAALKAQEDQRKALEQFAQQAEAVATSALNAAEGRADGRQRSLSGFGRGDRAREELEAQRQLNREYEKYEAQLARAAARNGVALDSPEFLRSQQAIREAREQELAAQADYFNELRRLQGDWLNGATRALEDYYDSSRNVAELIGEAFTNAFQGGEDALTEFFTTGRTDLSKFVADTNADIVRSIVRNQITGPLSNSLSGQLQSGEGFGGVLRDLFGGLFGGSGAGEGSASASGGLSAVAASSFSATTALGSLTTAALSAATSLGGTGAAGAVGSVVSGGGGFFSAVGSFFGSLFGRAAGGPVQAGGMFRVNEQGPELLTVGNKQFLMMGNQSGVVTPNGGGRNSAQNVTVNFAVQGPVDRRSEATIGKQVAQRLGRVQQRWM